MKEEAIVAIDSMGARGDGIAVIGEERVYVPFAAPGDRIRVRLRRDSENRLVGTPVEVLAGGPSRQPAACRHFGVCGGCRLQHLGTEAYRAWKLGRLEAALERQGLAARVIDPMAISPPGSRRRADLTASRRPDRLVLGFNAPLSHRIVDLEECPVLRPALLRMIAPLREVLLRVTAAGDKLDAKICETDSGIDLLLSGPKRFGGSERARLAAFAEEFDLARVALAGPRERGTEILVERRPVRVVFADVPVGLPPGAFLQATRDGEAALTTFVLEATAGARRIADLFAGVGTFALPLVKGRAKIAAFDIDRDAIGALRRAADAAMLSGVSSEARDLERRPLRPDALADFDAVILDPPRAGARAQANELARSSVPVICSISCHPATFARDARILCDGGYRLERIQPVDQFLWSPHLEVAALFRR
jgi:23S rRNA (uracil1939-C5)-methyltransferase